MSERSEVYAAIDGERTYQDERWSSTQTSTCGRHSVTEFMVFIQDYVTEAMHHLSRNGEPGASEFALHSMRKIAALGVACMEQHGAPARAALRPKGELLAIPLVGHRHGSGPERAGEPVGSIARQDERESIARWHEEQAAEARKKAIQDKRVEAYAVWSKYADFHSESARSIREGKAVPKEKA